VEKGPKLLLRAKREKKGRIQETLPKRFLAVQREKNY